MWICRCLKVYFSVFRAEISLSLIHVAPLSATDNFFLASPQFLLPFANFRDAYVSGINGCVCVMFVSAFLHAALQGFHIIPSPSQTMSPSDMAVRYPSLYPSLPSATFASAPRHPFHPLAILPPHASPHALPLPSDLDPSDLDDPDDPEETDQEHDLLAEWIAAQPVLSPLVRWLANLENRWGSGIYYVFALVLVTPIVGLLIWVCVGVSEAIVALL